MIRKILLAAASSLSLLGAAGAADLTVTVTGVRNSTGAIGGGLFNSEASFPRAPQSFASFRVRATVGNIVVTFHNLPPGRYAVSDFHDENDNGRLDTDTVGFPTEGIGFSNEARGLPPDFAKAAVDLAEQSKSTTVKLAY